MSLAASVDSARRADDVSGDAGAILIRSALRCVPFLEATEIYAIMTRRHYHSTTPPSRCSDLMSKLSAYARRLGARQRSMASAAAARSCIKRRLQMSTNAGQIQQLSRSTYDRAGIAAWMTLPFTYAYSAPTPCVEPSVPYMMASSRVARPAAMLIVRGSS